MQNMIIAPELKYVLLLNPANDDLSGPAKSANPQHQDQQRGLPRPQKQSEFSSNTFRPKSPNRQHKQARARGRSRGFVILPVESPACDTFTRVIFPRYGRTTKDEFRFVARCEGEKELFFKIKYKPANFDSKSQLSQTSQSYCGFIKI